MAEHPPLPVEILTTVVWQVSADCLDVVLSNKDLASHNFLRASMFHIQSTLIHPMGRPQYANGLDDLHLSPVLFCAALSVKLEVLSKILSIPIDNSSSLSR